MWKWLQSVFTSNQPPELTTIFSPLDMDLVTEYQKALYAPAISYAEKYPDIPKPKALTELELLAARWASGEIYPEKMPEMAANLLESGLDSPSMRRLAGEMHVRSIADVQDVLDKMFREFEVELPSSEFEARQHTSVQITREVIAGQRNPWKAASEMQRIWSFEIWHHKDLCDVAQLLEEIDCTSIARGELPQLTTELIEVLARLGAQTNREKRIISLGALEGKGWIADDFDAPLPDEILAQFEGRDKPDRF